MALTREQILARKTSTRKPEAYRLPGGDVVHIRGLSHGQAVQVQEAGTVAEKCDLMIHFGLTDPRLSLEDVAAWRAEEAAGTIEALCERLSEMSGMGEGAGKSSVRRP